MQEVAERTIWDMALTRDVDGYAIKPHSDNARKWVRLSHRAHALCWRRVCRAPLRTRPPSWPVLIRYEGCTSTPGSLQGEYRAGGRAHTPSQAAPPVERHQLHLLTTRAPTPPQVTTIYYLSKQGDGNDGAGTYILSKDGSDAAARAGGFQAPANVSFDGYTIHGRVPFVPNSVLAFAPCKTAYHAVPHLSAPGHTSRNTLQAFIKASALPVCPSLTPFHSFTSQTSLAGSSCIPCAVSPASSHPRRSLTAAPPVRAQSTAKFWTTQSHCPDPTTTSAAEISSSADVSTSPSRARGDHSVPQRRATRQSPSG